MLKYSVFALPLKAIRYFRCIRLIFCEDGKFMLKIIQRKSIWKMFFAFRCNIQSYGGRLILYEVLFFIIFVLCLFVFFRQMKCNEIKCIADARINPLLRDCWCWCRCYTSEFSYIIEFSMFHVGEQCSLHTAHCCVMSNPIQIPLCFGIFNGNCSVLKCHGKMSLSLPYNRFIFSLHDFDRSEFFYNPNMF